MIRSLWLAAWLVAISGLLACTKAPGAVCKDATGRSIENPSYCQLYPKSPTARPGQPAELQAAR